MSTETMSTTHQPCAQCGAPLDERQRYCVVCGTSRRHPDDPVARWLASATSRRSRPASAPTATGRGSDNRLIAVALALVPVAAAVGVLAGGNGGSSSDSRLLAALRARVAAPSAATAATAATAIASDFSLDHGYVVELRVLPGAGTTSAAIDKAKRAAEAAGASHVGVINPADFVLRPASDGYVIYAGEYRTRALADRALHKLRGRFPAAKVVHVTSAGGGATGAGTSTAVATQRRATPAQKRQGAQIVQQIQATKGKSYVQQQRKLPDTIVVP
jgi:hypothetical protein